MLKIKYAFCFLMLGRKIKLVDLPLPEIMFWERVDSTP